MMHSKTYSENVCMLLPKGLGGCGLGCVFGCISSAQNAIQYPSKQVSAGIHHQVVQGCVSVQWVLPCLHCRSTCCQILLHEWQIIQAQHCALMTISHQT